MDTCYSAMSKQMHFVCFQLITFLKKKEGFIGLVLKHIDASAMMDLLLRLISCVEPAPLRQEVLLVSSLTASGQALLNDPEKSLMHQMLFFLVSG